MGDLPAPATGKWYNSAFLLILLAASAPFVLPAPDIHGPHLQFLLHSLLYTHAIPLAMIVLALVLHHPPGERFAQLSLWRLDAQQVGLTARITALSIGGVWLCGVITYIVWHYFKLPFTPNPLLDWLKTADPSLTIAIVVSATVIAPIVEELVFRLIIYSTLRDALGQTPATILTAFVFAAIHFIPEEFLGLFLLGLCLQAIYRRTGNLASNILLHSLFHTTMICLTIIFNQVR